MKRLSHLTRHRQRHLQNSQNNLRRSLRHELLESRQLLASDLELGFMPPEPQDLLDADREYYSRIGNGDDSGNNPVPLVDLSDTFLLHSRPTATKTIYLDFDGFTARNTPWLGGREIVSPAWDPDRDGPEFSDNELRRIQGVWQRMSADFAPFDVNVTTEDPGEADLVNTGGNDERYGIRVVFTPDNTPAPGAGGVAYINSFNWGYNDVGATDTPSYVFNLGELAAAAAGSHEVGHSIGLSHDGTNDQHPTQPGQTYYNGHGSGENGWIPIMGSGYYQNVSTWDNGVYFGANNGGTNANYRSGADDLQVITTQNGFGYVPDPEANTISDAEVLPVEIDVEAGSASLSYLGVVSRTSDVDIFKIQAGQGTASFSIDPYITESFVNTGTGFERSIEPSYFSSSNWSQNQGANLDVEATLFDADGNVVAVSNPDGLRAEFVDIELEGGVYYLQIDGVGFGTPTQNPPEGYTDYGSLGQYLLTGTMPVALGLSFGSGDFEYTEDTAPSQIAASVDFFDATPGDYDGTVITASVTPAPASMDRIGFNPSLIGMAYSGGDLRLGSTVVGTVDTSSDMTASITLNGNATEAILRDVIRGFTFESTGDAPSSAARSVEFEIVKGRFSTSESIGVTIIQTNDAPFIDDAVIASVEEDAENPTGTRISEVFAGRFSDPDENAFLSGVAIVANTTPASEGVWQYSTNGGFWRSIDEVNDSDQRLVVSSSSFLRFLPGQDFFGSPQPLGVRAVDNSYTGSFSGAGTRVFLPVNIIGAESPISAGVGMVDISVTPVNDAPVANVAQVSFTVTQDEPLNSEIPADTFIDVDDASLSYRAELADGSPLPDWLRLDRDTNSFRGTPRKNDVQDLDIIVTAVDSFGAEATVPALIQVVNVNDPPEQLEFLARYVNENANGALVGRLNAFDPDADEITWVIEDDRFEIIGDRVQTKPGVRLDYELEQTIPTRVYATDNGTPALSAEFEIEILVRDINEFTPNLEFNTFDLPRDINDGEAFATLTSTDGDTFQSVAFSLLDDNSGMFGIDAATGSLLVLDSSRITSAGQQVFELLVKVEDDGEPARSRVVSIDVTVEQPPEITLSVELNRAPVGRQGLAFGTLTGVDELGNDAYRFELNDTRFELIDGQLALRQDQVLLASDVPIVTINVQAFDPASDLLVGEYPLTIEVFDASPWQNLVNPLDVDRSGGVNARDALLIINTINRDGSRALSDARSMDEQLLPDIDVSGDNEVRPVDALLIINYLNKQSFNGEGEADSSKDVSLLSDSDDSEGNALQQAAWTAAWEAIERERIGKRS